MFTLRVDEEIELRLLDLTQAEEQFAVIAANRAHIAAHLPWAQRHLSVEDTRSYIRTMRQRLANASDYGTGIYYRGQFVGSASLHVRDALARRGEIGYWLAAAYTGQGIMTRAVRALIAFGMTTLGLNRIIIRAATNNPRSAAIARRLGFTHEGTLRQEGWVLDHFVDLEVYGLLAQAYSSQPPGPDFWLPIQDGLALRPFRLLDAPALFALVDRNRAHLRRWLPWVDALTDVQHEEAFLRDSLQTRYAASNGGDYGIWYQGMLVGACGYHFWDVDTRRTEIGYWLDAAHTGRGIMTQVVRALTTYALQTLGLNRVIIRCAPGNAASCAIPQRLGFTYEGTLRADQWLHNAPEDSQMYAMLAADWPPKSGAVG